MKVRKRLVPGISIIGLGLLALVWQPGLTTPRSWAEEKPAAGAAAQGAPVEIKVPRGTLDALTAILTRRSIRDYTPHPVSAETIKLLLEAGLSAPSAFDERSTEFVVINDRKILDEIHSFNPNPKSFQLKKATVAILVCGNPAKEKDIKGQGMWLLDGAVASENILIAANALGLGAVWTAIYPFQDRIPKVQKLLNLPEQVIPLNIIPLGYPAERKMPHPYDASRVHPDNRW
jgi:nitroreductase